MNYTEEAFVFECHGDSLVAIVTQPARSACTTGLLVIVGGPQYRVGSHRQFVQLSRTLAENGLPCLRFDYRGMGDSEGGARDFTSIHEDIAAAVDAFFDRIPGLTDIVLWGLCDGATAAAFYASEDKRISGLILLNPWVHTEQVKARVYLRHYYLPRIFSSAFWRKLLNGDLDPRPALKGALQMMRRAFSAKTASDDSQPANDPSLPRRVYESLTHQPIRTLILLSGKDLVAQEFETLINSDESWLQLSKVATIERFPDADHTFSKSHDAGRTIQQTIDWISRF